MGESNSRKRIIILVSIGLLITIVAVILAFIRFQTSADEATVGNTTPIEFPSGGEYVNEVVIPEGPNTIETFEPEEQIEITPQLQVAETQEPAPWQVDIVDYSAETNAFTQEVEPPTQPVSNYSIDDLDLDLNINGNTQSVAPAAAPQRPIYIPSTPDTSQESQVPELDFPSMSNIRFTSCGSVTVPTGFALALFTLSAKSNPTVICLGEAIANSNCGNKRATVQSEGVDVGAVFIAERPDDNVCSVGAPLSDELISMCSVERLMDVGTGEDQTLSQWRQYFKDEPGRAFADLYFKNQDAFSNPSAEDLYDCKVYDR